MPVSRRLFVARLSGALVSLPLLPASSLGQTPVPAVPPRPADVGTVDGMIRAFYEVISGPAGAPREWSRDRTLYIPGVKFVSLDVADGRIQARVLSHQEFVDASDPVLTSKGFYETEVHRRTERFGNFVHVMSTYESRHTANGPVIERGINSIQLFWDGSRWWIASAVWDQERKDNPIPKEYAPDRR